MRGAALRRKAGRLLGSTEVARAACAVALAATYLVTWRTWNDRVDPPVLPLLSPLSGLPFGVPLIASALAAVRYPRTASVLHAALVVLAVLGDQLRIQPEVASLALLLVACSFGPSMRSVGRWHLSALWIWAGLHKLLSAGWTYGGAAYIARAAEVPDHRSTIAVLLPVAELGLGLLSLRRSTWIAVRIGAPLLHVGIVGVLVHDSWNEAVWPWNLALAVAAPVLFRPAEPMEASARPTAARWATLAGLLLVLEPVGTYLEIGHPYLQHHLYSSSTPVATWCGGTGCRSDFDTFDSLRVPVPPWPHTYRAWFELRCNPDELLGITGYDTRFADPVHQAVPCPRSRP